MNRINDKLRAVIFDMDGVIIDSEPIYFRVEQQYYAELGLDISKNEHSRFVGMSMTDFWKTIKHKYSLNQPIKELIERHKKLMTTAIKTTSPLPITPKIVDFIDSIKTNEISIALASSSSRELIDLVIKKSALEEKFDQIISGENVLRGKPAPDIFNLVAEKLAVRSQACLVIEDSTNGIKAAKKAGMKCVGFKNPNSGNQDLTNADLVISSFENVSIKKIWRELCRS